jgi:hypothetical protein
MPFPCRFSADGFLVGWEICEKMHANPLCNHSAENQMKKIQKPPEEYSKYKNTVTKYKKRGSDQKSDLSRSWRVKVFGMSLRAVPIT